LANEHTQENIGGKLSKSVKYLTSVGVSIIVVPSTKHPSI